MKKRIWIGFLGFLAFMAVCTVITKGIYKAGLARVSVCHAQKQSILHEINAAGSFAAGYEYGVYTAEDLRVSAVYVKKGQTVTDGDILFSVDLPDLAEQIRQTQAQYEYLKAQLADTDAKKAQRDREREKTQERLLADYESLIAQQDLLIAEYQLAADSAMWHMQNDTEAESVSGSDAGAESEAEKEKERKLLQTQYQRAQKELERAVLQKEEALKAWNRSLEDARESFDTETAQRVKLEKEAAQVKIRLDRLEELKKDQGMVCAPEAGVICEIFLKTGERTSDKACLLYTVAGGAGSIRILLAKEDADLLFIGDSVSLEYKTALGEKKKTEGIISYMEQEGGQRVLRVDADPSGLMPGQTVHMQANVRSGVYETVIPRSALYTGERSEAFVYAVEECEGILGTQERVRKIPVSVEEENADHVAVKSPALGTQTRIVKSSSRELAQDDVVRVSDE